jgi:hypothetical protein
MAAARTLHWNGKDLPEELRGLPPGTYVVESVDQPPLLTDDEETGLIAALASLQAGKGCTREQVQQAIDAILHR